METQLFGFEEDFEIMQVYCYLRKYFDNLVIVLHNYREFIPIQIISDKSTLLEMPNP